MRLPVGALFLVFCGCFFTACESDVTTSTTLEKKLVLNPTHLEGEQYQSYVLKARITNMPLSDVDFFWSFDEGDTLRNLVWDPDVVFYQNKIHNVRVKAFDAFTGELLGYDSLRADIRPPLPFVELSPKLVDTLLPMDNDGVMQQPLKFSVKSSSPVNTTRFVWDFGDGTPEYVDSNVYYTYHSFAHAGTSIVRVKVYERSGMYIGSDSAVVNFRFPEFGLADLEHSKVVTVFLTIGNEHPVASDSLYKDPLIVGLDSRDDATETTFQPTGSFSSNLWRRELVGSGFDFYFYLKDTISGEFSSDLRSLRSVTVGVNDTGRLLAASSTRNDAALRYAFKLKNLELVAVNDQAIVYSSTTEFLSDFLEGLTFHAATFANHACGVFTGLAGNVIKPERPFNVFGVVRFSR